MYDRDDDGYYLSRAEQEEEAACKSFNPRAASIHRTLASRYRAIAGDSNGNQKLSVVRD